MTVGASSGVADLVRAVVGELGLVAHDPHEHIVTVVATRIPAPPIVIRCFSDGWVTLCTGAGTLEEFDPTTLEPGMSAVVSAIVAGRWAEWVMLDPQGDRVIQAAWSDVSGNWSRSPAAAAVMTVSYPAWSGPETKPIILPG